VPFQGLPGGAATSGFHSVSHPSLRRARPGGDHVGRGWVWIWTFNTSKRTLPPLNILSETITGEGRYFFDYRNRNSTFGLRVRWSCRNRSISLNRSVGELLQRHRPRTERKGVPDYRRPGPTLARFLFAADRGNHGGDSSAARTALLDCDSSLPGSQGIETIRN